MMGAGRAVAVIGAGPAGIFASRQLAAAGLQVALINKDIRPGGLAEYGIYPTKHKMKEGLRNQFRSILTDPNVHYFGNVEVGRNGFLSLGDLQEMGFSAVLVATGAQAAKKLGIPGEGLKRVYSAKEVVFHYNQLPPFSENPLVVGHRVAIVGAGNVMMDVAHWLIDERQVEEVVAVVRRGPGEVKFDQKELETIAANLDLEALRREFDHLAPLLSGLGQAPDQLFAHYQEITARAVPHQSASAFRIRFCASPVEIAADDADGVGHLVVEQNTLVRSGEVVKPVGTGVKEDLDVDTVILAIGDTVDGELDLPVSGNQYASQPAPRYPVEGHSFEAFDPQNHQEIPGVFLAGWSRVASTGLVGTARKDAVNAAAALLAHLSEAASPRVSDSAEVIRMLEQRTPKRIDFAAFQRLEAYEHQVAQATGRPEFKLETNEKMLAVIASPEKG